MYKKKHIVLFFRVIKSVI